MGTVIDLEASGIDSDPAFFQPTQSTNPTATSVTIMRAYMLYRPLRVFLTLGLISIATGTALGVRFLYFYIAGMGGGHVQSLILTAILLIVGFQVILIGLLADLVGSNRKIMEETLFRVRATQLELHETTPRPPDGVYTSVQPASERSPDRSSTVLVES